MIAFGIRNMEDIELALNEINRTLKRGGRLMVLEFSLPTSVLMKNLYLVYFKLMLPILGKLVSGHPDAYSYLPESVEKFPGQPEFKLIMEKSGFTKVNYQNFTFGICTAYIGIKD